MSVLYYYYYHNKTGNIKTYFLHKDDGSLTAAHILSSQGTELAGAGIAELNSHHSLQFIAVSITRKRRAGQCVAVLVSPLCSSGSGSAAGRDETETGHREV